MFFTIPGISLGFFACWMLNVPVNLILNNFTKIDASYDLK